MWRIDLHVHTRQHSACAEFLDPWELGAAAHRAEITGIVLTEHDNVWAAADLSALRRALAPLRLYSGVELTARDGHVIALGTAQTPPIATHRTVAETTKVVAALGGFSILAHPMHHGGDWSGAAPEALGAVEVLSTVTHGDKAAAARALAERWRLPAVAGSDAHAIDRVGQSWTRLPELPRDERELARLLREGAGTPETRD